MAAEEEIAAYRIIRSIACRDVDSARIAIRDAKSYCSILLDDSNRKPIDDLNGIYRFAGDNRAEVRQLLEQ